MVNPNVLHSGVLRGGETKREALLLPLCGTKIALGLAVLGRVDFVLTEIRSLIPGEDSFLLPLGELIMAIGITLMGIAVLRARRWVGWQQSTPLITGVYPFVVVFPFIFITDEPNVLAIAGWGLTWCLLGYAMWSSAVEERPSRVR